MTTEGEHEHMAPGSWEPERRVLVRVIDFETRGFPKDGNGQIVEVAAIDLVETAPRDWRPVRKVETLVNPGREIPPEASAVHHIVDAMVAGKPTWDSPEVEAIMFGDVPPGHDLVFCAHFAKFERECLQAAGWFEKYPDLLRSWVDTYKTSLWAWPECPQHTVQCLRYWLNLRLADRAAAVPHRALGDAYVTGAILRRTLRVCDVDVAALVDMSAQPALLPRLTFGMHAMLPLSEVPDSYLTWMISPKGVDDEDALYTARFHLERRKKASRGRDPLDGFDPNAPENRPRDYYPR